MSIRSKCVSQILLFLIVTFLSILYSAEVLSQQATNSTVTVGDTTSVKPTKLALLVGINDYKHVSDLNGAVNDVINMKTLLIESFGFPNNDEHIRILTDGKATREAIIKAIEEHLIAKAETDSIVVFHYSGHGSQMKDDPEGDEMDKLDETIVPHDSGHIDPHPNKDITDDELNYYLGKLTEKTPNVTVIFDSCHSGSATRGSGFARTVEPDMRPPPKRERPFTIDARGVNEGKNDLRPENSRYALISGCAAQELSYELYEDGQPYGALTWYLVDQVRTVGADATYRDIMDVVKTRVSARYSTQNPQLEGPGEDQFVFSARSQVSMPYVLAKPTGNDEVILEAGQVHRVTIGSKYDLYPPGTKSFDESVKPIVKLEVTSVDVNKSIGKIKEGQMINDAARAVEREHYWPDPVLGVFFMDLDKSKTLQNIKAKLAKYKHITSIETDSGYDLLLQDYEDETDGKRYIITEDGDPKPISPRVAVTDPDVVSRVVEQVTHWAKWFNTLRIKNNDPKIDVKFEIKLSQEGRDSEAGFNNQEVSNTLIEGEKFNIEVINNSDENLYIALLDLSSDGSVSVIYPRRGTEEFVAPGKTWSKQLETFVPDGRDSVRDVLKLIATTSPADFNFLRQEAVRGGSPLSKTRGRNRNPLEQLLANAAIGTTRGAREVRVETWTTVDRVLEVRRKD